MNAIWDGGLHGVSAEYANSQGNTVDRSYYAEVMPVIQSSGARKSLLPDHYSTHHLRVTYTFRTGAQSGYPPGDSEILLQGEISVNVGTKRSIEHGLAVGLIGSTISKRECSNIKHVINEMG